ncbi:iron-containing alcohol dehydrogenase [Streptomyces sp. NPDC052016]|uniref:iron-containing alcohol dehydrogenase n=1 Tax=Streptomyces sp. NPDC052016 TaxID=3365680 RepID=UPI0037D5FECB
MWLPVGSPQRSDRPGAGRRGHPCAGGRTAGRGGRPVRPRGREQLLYGAYLAAVAFSSAGSGLHHTICHVLGGRYAAARPDARGRAALCAGVQRLRHAGRRAPDRGRPRRRIGRRGPAAAAARRGRTADPARPRVRRGPHRGRRPGDPGGRPGDPGGRPGDPGGRPGDPGGRPGEQPRP